MRSWRDLGIGTTALCALATVAGCGSSAGGQPMTCSGPAIVASEKNDYAFSSSITLPPISVAQMSNLTFDWSGLTHDFEGHALDPSKDFGMAIVMFWSLPLADFEKQLNADALFTSDLILSPPLSLELTSGGTSAQLYDFTINTTPVTPAMINQYFDATLYTPANASFIVGVQSGIDLGRQLRMLQSFNLDPTSTNTNVVFKDDSTKLTYSANLHDLTITGVPGGTPALTLDWSQMTTNGLGRPFTEGYRDQRHRRPLHADARPARDPVPRSGSHRNRDLSGGSRFRLGPRLQHPQGRKRGELSRC